jgi:hypothetical protein
MLASRGTGSHAPDSDGTTGTTPTYGAFHSTAVLLCGFPADTAAKLQKQIEDAGGRIMIKAYSRQLPSVIVVGDVRDKAYQVRMPWRSSRICRW